MRLRLAIVAVVLQVFALAYMAGEREWIIRTGRTILLRTAPIDPNDTMRGDYVRLDYDISEVTKEQCRDGALKMFAPNGYVYSRQWRDTKVYALLKINETGVAELVTVTDQKPADGLILRGRVESVNDHSLRFRYGIEAFFMQQGSAQKLEDTRRKDRPGVPLDMEVAVGQSGIAVLKGYHWEPLGISVTFERPVAQARNGKVDPDTVRRQRLITGVNVVLKNYGPDDVAIIDLPDAGSFRLVPDLRRQETSYHWVGENRTTAKPDISSIIVLKPGQTHTTRIDLTSSRWFVSNSTLKADPLMAIPLGEISDPWSASFRIEYAPPTQESTDGLTHADLIRHGKLRSRAFNPTTSVD